LGKTKKQQHEPMKFGSAGKISNSRKVREITSEYNLIETIDIRNFTLRTSVSFEHFIYNGEFDPGSG
jgi:hypothetical protein